ncbi:MAG: DUF4256 domain-containing protein [Patescibacteria group bacterium]
MSKILQERALVLLEEAKKRDELDYSIEDRLARLLGVEARSKLGEVLETASAPEEEKRGLTPEQQTKLLSTLEARFGEEPKHYKRPQGIKFDQVKSLLEANPAVMVSLAQMENTDGLPDIIAERGNAYIFGDCSAESPNRRDLTRDQAAEMAKAFGVKMMPWGLYSDMVERGDFDIFDHKTMSWLGEGMDETDDEADEGAEGFATVGHPSYETDPYYTNCTKSQIANGHHPTIGWRGIVLLPKVK